MEMQLQPVLDFSSLSLTAATILATYVGYRCFKAPRQAPQTKTKTSESTSEPDSLRRFGLIAFISAFRFAVIASGVVRCVFTVFRPLRPSPVCPNPENLDLRLFVWSVYNIISILLVVVGGGIRIASYHALGTNFTFTLNKSDRLVVDGIYKYIQHPGYTGGWTCAAGIAMFFVRFEGGLGCYVPAVFLKIFSLANLATFMVIMIPVFLVRVSEEEKLLHRAFGNEWEDYHKRTQRFLPWIL